ncbi:MAG: hypothetical protein JW994_03155, partial [Candidatus Omnitrophica bacterium]|nr:hypothetical protein [Candidatus Omnitrophota bacterium]
MALYPYIALVSSIIMFTLAIFVLTRNIKNRLYQIFFLFNISAAVWVFNSFLLWSSKNAHFAYMWKGANFVFSAFIPAFFMHLSFIITNERKKFKKILIIVYAISAFFAICSQTPLFIRDVVVFKPYFNFIPVQGILFIPFIVFFYTSAAFVYFRLVNALKKASGNFRIQIQYIVFGTVLGFISSLIYFLLFYKINFEKFFPHDLLTLFYTIIMAYAIVRHQLMEIEVIIKKTLVFAGLLASVFAMLLLPTFVIQEYLIGSATLSGRITGLTISGIIIILAMRRIENFLINVTDKFLFQKKYDYKELLKTFTNEVLTVLDIDVLVHTTVDKLSNIVKIESCGLLLMNDTKSAYELVASVGVDKNWRNISFKL